MFSESVLKVPLYIVTIYLVLNVWQCVVYINNVLHMFFDVFVTHRGSIRTCNN